MTPFAWRSLVLALLAAGAGALCWFAPELSPGHGCGVVMALPSRLPQFVSEMREPDATEKALLPPDTEIAKAVYYSSAPDKSLRDIIQCEVVLSGAERRSIHRPEVCLQGQGWTLTQSSTRRLPMDDGRELEIRDLGIRKEIKLKDGSRQLVRAHFFYWFIGQDVSTSSHAGRIWLTLRDSITRGVNHRWAYASALALVTDNLDARKAGERSRSDAATLQLLDGFVQSLAPRFQKSFMDNPQLTAAN